MHRATTKEGVSVAVKIQYPSLRQNMASDLAVFRTMGAQARHRGPTAVPRSHRPPAAHVWSHRDTIAVLPRCHGPTAALGSHGFRPWGS